MRYDRCRCPGVTPEEKKSFEPMPGVKLVYIECQKCRKIKDMWQEIKKDAST